MTTDTTHSRSTRPLSHRGPGLLESVGWTLGYAVVQAVVAVGLVVMLAWMAFGRWPHKWEINQVVTQMETADLARLSLYVTGGATLASLFIIVPAAFARLRPHARTHLGTHRPDIRQLVLLAGAVLPLGILSDELYGAALPTWESIRTGLSSFWPLFVEAGQNDTISLIKSHTPFTSYPLLLVIVGVGPAIGEELVFRGVIGRGLVSRMGRIHGVLLTSLLFAVAHGSPPHAIATLPLAIFLHLAYLWTGTIWAPILVHFLNNAISVTMLKYGLGGNLNISPNLLVSAGMYVAAIGVLLWYTRSGRPIPISRLNPTLPVPRMSTGGASLAVASPHWLTWLATTGAIGFTWTFVAAATAG